MAKRTPKPSAGSPAPTPQTRRKKAPVDAPASPDIAFDAPAVTKLSEQPSEHDIRLRAYHRYLARGGHHGMDVDDWIAAEEDLRNG